MKTFREFLMESYSIKELNKKYKDKVQRLNVYELPDKISIDLIIVKDKNKGVGTDIMNDIIEYANKVKKIIILTPSDEFGGDKDKLINFYKRFGFVENKDNNRIPGIFEQMYKLVDNIK